MSVTNQLMSTIPAKLRMPFLLGGTGLLLLATIYLIRVFPGKTWIAVLVVTVGLGLIVGVFKLISMRMKRRKAAQAEGAIVDAASGAAGESDPAKIARIDQDDRAWREGLDSFRKYNGNGALATLPWILVAGEAGSGKTEAVRHSEISFAEGLKQRYQGTGGTLYMNWWFANEAIILDTAGRLMLPEHEQERDNREWIEFLRRINRARPHCPINGMLLFIPATSLLENSLEEISDKAGRVAAGLECIKRELGIRFPVYVVISKCDMIKGFREFFAQLDDPVLQHQMLGWSNPAGLDDPFDPKQIEEHMATVRERLVRRRLMLLLDPPHIPGASIGSGAHGRFDPIDTSTFSLHDRRINHVDSLYVFPDELMRIGPRLTTYLEKIFTPGPFTQHPPFVRGMYFTSSMQEGAEIDAALAELMGVSTQDVPEMGGWRKDKAYFIKDVLTQKVFKEQGLVTRATNADANYRRKKWMVNTAGAGAVGLAALAGVWAYLDVSRSVAGQAGWWGRVASAADKDYIGKTGLRPIFRDGRVVDNASVEGMMAPNVAGSMVEILAAPNDRASPQGEIRLPWWLVPMKGWLADAPDIRGTQLRMVEEYGLNPLVRGVGARLSNETWDDEYAPAALGEMLRIEAVASGMTTVAAPTANSFTTLTRYYSGQAVDSEMANQLAGAVAGYGWTRLTAGESATPIRPATTSGAIQSLKRYWTQRVQAPDSDEFKKLRSALETYESGENRLLELDSNEQTFVEDWAREFQSLRSAKEELDQVIPSGFEGLAKWRSALYESAKRDAKQAFAAAGGWLPPVADDTSEANGWLGATRAALAWTPPEMSIVDEEEWDDRYFDRIDTDWAYMARFRRYEGADTVLAALENIGPGTDIIEFGEAVKDLDRPDCPTGRPSESLMEKAHTSACMVVNRMTSQVASRVDVPQSGEGFQQLIRRHSQQRSPDAPPADFRQLRFVGDGAGNRSRDFDFNLIEDLKAGWEMVGKSRHQEHYDGYIQAYRHYWTQDICHDFELTANGWSAHRIAINDLNIGITNERLREIDRVRSEALSRVDARFESPRHLVGIEALQRARTIWALLPDQAGRARAELESKMRADYYLPGELRCGETECDLHGCYWRRWIDTTAQCLADDVDNERNELVRQFSAYLRFPLVCDGAGELSMDELRAASEIIQKILDIRQPGADSTLPHVFRTAADSVQNERWQQLFEWVTWLRAGGKAEITFWSGPVVTQYEVFHVGQTRVPTAPAREVEIQLSSLLELGFGRQGQPEPAVRAPQQSWQVLRSVLSNCDLSMRPWTYSITVDGERFDMEITPHGIPSGAALFRTNSSLFQTQGVSR